MARYSKFAPKARHWESQQEQPLNVFQSPPHVFPQEMSSPSAQPEDHDDQHDRYLPSQGVSPAVEIVSIQQATDKSQGDLVQKTKMIRKADGCRCKKNKCGDNYCSCAKLGQRCGINCECSNCKNHRYVNKPMRCVYGEFWMECWKYKLKNRKL